MHQLDTHPLSKSVYLPEIYLIQYTVLKQIS